MLICAIDTETTDLVKTKELPHSSNQPDVVQFCAKLFDEHNIYATIDLLVIPEKTISPTAEKIHGISRDIVERAGVSRRVMVSMFQNFLKKSDMVIAHNLNFDKRVMLTAYHRENIDSSELVNKKSYCTMLESTPLLKIPTTNGYSGFKWPTLQEAYQYFINPSGFSGAHNAQVDVDALIEVFRAMYFGKNDRAASHGHIGEANRAV